MGDRRWAMGDRTSPLLSIPTERGDDGFAPACLLLSFYQGFSDLPVEHDHLPIHRERRFDLRGANPRFQVAQEGFIACRDHHGVTHAKWYF